MIILFGKIGACDNNSHYTSDSSEDNHYTRKRKYKAYEEISGEFKKVKPPTFNGETKKGEEAES